MTMSSPRAALVFAIVGLIVGTAAALTSFTGDIPAAAAASARAR